MTVELASDVTLIVGANGAGKSNIVGAFEMLGRIVDKQLNDYLVRQGGLQRFLHRNRDSSRSEAFELQVWGAWRGDLSNGYSVRVESGPEDSGLVTEQTYLHDRSRYPEPMSDYLGLSRESKLRDSASTSSPAGHRMQHVLDVLTGCRVFHFDDTSSDAPPKLRSELADNVTLAPDARNIASVLHDMRERHPDAYARLIRAVQTVAPFFHDFVLEPEDATLVLRWKERGLDGTFSGDSLSDGTLRFICLATLLLQPDPPQTVVLDEPELGLHPFAIHQLAALMRRAAEGRRIIAATQSVTLLEQFSVDEVAVAEREQTGTVVTRPERARLEAWLDDYSLGDLWEKNLLGGRPAASPSHG